MTTDQKNSLVAAGYTKSVCPFGILIVGTSLYDDSYMQYAANVVSNLMDPDHDGNVNTGNTNGNADLIQAKAKTTVSKAFLGGSYSDTDVATMCAKFTSSTDLTSCNGLYQSKFQGRGTTWIKQSITEEVFNFVAIYGMSGLTPNTLPVDFKSWYDSGFCAGVMNDYVC
jgi:hypothetical protein